MMRSTELYAELLAKVNCGLVVIGVDHRVEVWNDWMATVSGLPSESAFGAYFEDVLPLSARGRVGQAVREALTYGRSAIISCALHERPLRDFSASPLHSVTVHALRTPEPRALVVVRDVSNEVEFSERIEAMSQENVAQREALRFERDRYRRVTQFDSLTGLANRHQVRKVLSAALARSATSQRPGAVVLIDLDRFSEVNSSVGPGVADHVLQLVAERLAEQVRSGDIVARVGGDEFIIVLDGLDRVGDAELAGQRILRAFERPFDVSGFELFVTASIGLAIFPTRHATVDEVLTNVGLAMNRAKRAGGCRLQTYYERMSSDSGQRLSLSSALHRALDNGEFVLVYQPQVLYPSGELIGVEALLRWAHPERGLVSPAEFIPMLEESGLICQVGAWVVAEACRQGMAWRQQGLPPFRLAVNVSARQVREGRFLDDVALALDQSGLPGSQLEVELTETLLMQDVGSSNELLRELKKLGVRVAIDDFGTGYSSLAYLRRFQVDTLKIDRAFSRNVAVDADDLAICRTIISLGKTLELNVLAEGVETQEQLEILWDANCDFFQGYYFGRPMGAEALPAWISQREAPVLSNAAATDFLLTPSFMSTELLASIPPPSPVKPLTTPQNMGQTDDLQSCDAST